MAIVAVGSSSEADLAFAVAADGTITGGRDTAATAQRFLLEPVEISSTRYTIRPADGADRCLRVDPTTPGLRIAGCDSADPNQRFGISRTGENQTGRPEYSLSANGFNVERTDRPDGDDTFIVRARGDSLALTRFTFVGA